MKKISFMFLLFLTMIMLASCTDINSGKKYRVTVTGEKDQIINRVNTRYAAGETISIKTSIIYDASLYVYVDGEKISQTHTDDRCWLFEFIMPEKDVTVHITWDMFYGKDYYNFDELFWDYDLVKRDAYKVSIESNNTTDKTSFIEIKHSTKIEDILGIKFITDQIVKVVDINDVPEQTKSNTYILHYKEEPADEYIFSFKIAGKYLYWNSFSSYRLFEFQDDFVLHDILEPDYVSYRFKYDGRSSDIKSYTDETFSKKYFEIGTVEFVLYNGIVPDIEPSHYIDSRYGEIKLISETIFELNNVYYEIIDGAEYWPYE